MIKKIKEIIFNHFDLNRDGKIQWHEPIRATTFVVLFYGGVGLIFYLVHILFGKLFKFLEM